MALDNSRFEEAFPSSNPSSAFSSPHKPLQQPWPQPQQSPQQQQQQSPQQSPQQQPPSFFDGTGTGAGAGGRGEDVRGGPSPGLSRGPSTPMASEETRASLAAVSSPITPMVSNDPTSLTTLL